MRKLFVSLLFILALASCKSPDSFRTYEQAEKEFRKSLTFHDTISVLMLGQNFMDAMKSGDISSELNNLCTVYNDTLYKLADVTIRELYDRFSAIPVSDYALSGYSFSTQGNNDLSFRYTTSGKVGSAPAFKIMFNPVKVEDTWYLTLKDGNMSSKDKSIDEQVHPLSPAPAPIVLNKKNQ